MLDAEGRLLRDRILRRFASAGEASRDDALFDADARTVFAYQFARNAPYAAFCERRGITPERIQHWSQIPAVPTAAFKEIALVAGDVADAEAIFRTSGTTRGSEKRGTHHVLDLSIYHAALLASFQAWVLPDLERMLMLSLLPRAGELPDSSLAHMIEVVIERLGSAESDSVASIQNGIDHERLDDMLRTAEQKEQAVCLLGTSLSFVHWLDSLRARGSSFRLPPGSRLMDTGGSKGRTREITVDKLRADYAHILGLPEAFCINEYGMTELGSQFYDTTLRDHVAHGHAGPRRKVPPPWVRTRVVDADTLQPVKDGAVGLLQHFDLANLGSVIAVQTEDLGSMSEDGFVVQGRVLGALPRGCSIAMDELLTAAERTRTR